MLAAARPLPVDRADLTGTERVTPRVRAMRVERPGHALLRALPRAWSRDDGDADFLQRFLAPAEGMLHELDERAAQRAVLVDPQATPQEALPWLASFAGLVLDRRWPGSARRGLIAEAYPLYRRRGTKAALTRILEIYLGRRAGDRRAVAAARARPARCSAPASGIGHRADGRWAGLGRRGHPRPLHGRRPADGQ